MARSSAAWLDSDPTESDESVSAQPGAGGNSYAFATFRLEPDGTLTRAGKQLHLPPKELAALRLLLDRAGQIVSPAVLKQELWGDVHVTGDSVPRCLSSLRARLDPEECIQTIYKRGYRLAVEVRALEPAPSSNATPRLAIMPLATGPTVPAYLGMAIAEETIAHLALLDSPAASLLARDSVFTLAARGLTSIEIGVALNADLVLTGSITALAFQFRLRAEMIRVADGVQIWVEDLLIAKNQLADIESALSNRLLFRLRIESGQPAPERQHNPLPFPIHTRPTPLQSGH